MEIERKNMVRNQVRAIGIENPDITNAMLEIPRHKFVSKKFSSVAYSDAELPILEDDEKKLIARPEMLAKLLNAAEITSDDVVLEIGCGTGYSTAIISKIAKHVVGIDSCNKSIEKAKNLAEDLHITNIDFHNQNLKEEFSVENFTMVIVNGAAFTRDPIDISSLNNTNDLFDLNSKKLIDNLIKNFNQKIICVEGYYKYAPMHIFMYKDGQKKLLDEIYLPELAL